MSEAPPIITYSLRGEARNSDEYYRTIAGFADEWLAYARRTCADLSAGFRAFRLRAGQADRSDGEYAFELLVLGVLLLEHSEQAARLPQAAARLLTALAQARERWPQAAGALKPLYGWAAWASRASARRAAPAGDDVGRLLAWLRAQGDSARADRLAQWQGYFDDAGLETTRRAIARSRRLAGDFVVRSARVLGRFTDGVERFLRAEAPHYRRRYDAEFVARSRLQHHLGLLGTEVLSRAYRQRFLAAPRKIVIVPPCMRAQPDDECQAVETPLGAKCQACKPGCRVHQITKLGEKRGFDVYMIPDELRVFGAGASAGGLGVLGVSCALTNWAGGWEAEGLGVPAQGLLLDYVGCRYHWHPEGIATDVNMHKLREILEA